jgi:hypothetical protein
MFSDAGVLEEQKNDDEMVGIARGESVSTLPGEPR